MQQDFSGKFGQGFQRAAPEDRAKSRGASKSRCGTSCRKITAATASGHNNKAQKTIISKKPFRYSSEFFTPVKNQPPRNESSFAPALKNPFRILRTIFASEQKRRSGFKGCPLAKCTFGWCSRPKVLLSIALTSIALTSNTLKLAQRKQRKNTPQCKNDCGLTKEVF